MKSRLLAALVLLTTVSFAQQKTFTYDQAFKGAGTQISKPLPMIRKWADGQHYVEMRKDEADGKTKAMLVDVKTGKAEPYQEAAPGVAVPAGPALAIKGARNQTLSPDGKWAAYTKADNNFYLFEVDTKKESQITRDGSETILNGYASWVYYEEILGRASNYKAFWWSPDSKSICYMRFDDAEVPMFPIYVANGQHGYLERTRYPKVGDKNPTTKVGVLDVASQQTVWADFNYNEDIYFGTPEWTPQGKLWISWMPRTQDLLKVYEVNPANGSKKEVYTESQKTWISLDDTDRFHFLQNSNQVIISSDQTGWKHLYLYNTEGGLVNPITTGNFTVTDIVSIDEKNKTVYFRARKENSARFDLYKVGFNGKNMTRLTFGDYSHDVINMSPNNEYFITTYSNVQTPPAMALVDTKGKKIRDLGDIKGASFGEYALAKTELTRVKSDDGKFDLPVSITYPINFDPNKKYPVLISIYGGPDAGTVYDRWRQPAGATQWFAQEGILQVAFDNRSSGHFGKEGQNYIHRQLGIYEIEDYMTCARWLKAKSFVDTSKVCITGGSFGGYMTCMALTYGAGVFTHGIANASVTDWSLYDTHYTERFMDTPAENPDGYKKTSVMNYTDRYKGLLRIVHGTTDDNVHMQNSLQLINKLQDQKKHFEFMLYPNERHGIGANVPAKRVHNSVEAYKFYYEQLLQKPMPEQFWK
jgi:dipeptidyl-peptidase-4